MGKEILRLADVPKEEVEGHKEFFSGSLVNLPEKGVTVRVLDVSVGGVGPVPAHSHTDCHLFLVLEGVLEIDIAGERYRVEEGSFIKVPQGEVHQLACREKDGMRVLAIKWSP
jgi:quercetin dioxygenase-like cupin family protein